MSINCTFHRSESAHFECFECGSTFCDDCVSIRDTDGFSGKNRDYFCPGCNVPLEMLSLSNIIEPFTNRLTSIFLYPFQLTPLVLTLVLAGLAALFPTSPLVRLFVWVVMVKYAYEILARTAQGGLKAPVLTWKLINQNVQLVFKQYIIFALAGFFAFFVSQYAGIIGLSLYGIMVLLAVPAIIMLLVSTGSVLHAINPLGFIGLITRIGLPYFVMYLFLFFLLAAPTALFAYLPTDVFPQQVYIFFTLFLKQFYTIISYHLMGYVLLQYHKEIGYQVDYEFFMQQRGGKKKLIKNTAEDELKNGLAVLIKMGRYNEAIERLRPFILDEAPDLELSGKYLQLLKMAGEKDKAANYSARHLDLLVEMKKKKKALDLFVVHRNSGGAPPAPETVFVIAAWYRGRNDFQKAIDTYVYFLKQYEKHSLQPEVYFELAKLLHEQANNTAKAKQILLAVIKSYPKHDLIPQAREYLALVN